MSTTDSTTDATDSGSNPTTEASPTLPVGPGAKPARKAGKKSPAKVKKIVTKHRRAVSKPKKSVKAKRVSRKPSLHQAIPVVLLRQQVESIDRSFKRLGLKSRMNLIRTALSTYLASRGEKKAAALIEGTTVAKGRSRKA